MIADDLASGTVLVCVRKTWCYVDLNFTNACYITACMEGTLAIVIESRPVLLHGCYPGIMLLTPVGIVYELRSCISKGPSGYINTAWMSI